MNKLFPISDQYVSTITKLIDRKKIIYKNHGRCSGRYGGPGLDFNIEVFNATNETVAYINGLIDAVNYLHHN